MSANLPDYRKGSIRAVECLQEGWNLVKEQYWLFVGIAAIGMLIAGAVPFGILMGPMYCGIYLCLLQRRRGQPVSFETLFKGFDYFTQSLVATLLHIVPMFVLFIPVYLIFLLVMMGSVATQGSSGPPAGPPPFFFIMFPLMFIAIFVIGIGVTALFIFTYPLIADRKLSGVDAVRASFHAAMGNLGGVLGLIALNALLGIAGLLLCYVGLFLFMPVGFAACLVAYEQAFGIRGGAAA